MNQKGSMKEAYSLKVFFGIAIPIIIQGMVFQLQSIVDKAFLGNLETDYLTAVGVTQSPFNMTMMIIMAIATGLGIVVGHRYGAKNMDDLKEAIRSTNGYNLILSFILLALWLLFGHQFFKLIQVDDNIIPYAMSYVGIIALYLPLYAIDCSIQTTLQAFGITKPIMYAGVMKVLLNVVLDWIMIFGKFGFPAMGIAGAAIATLLSNIVATILLSIYFYNAKNLPVTIKLNEIIGFQGKIYKKIAIIGLPTGLEYFLWHIGNLVLISFLNTIDTMGVAVYVLTNSIGIIAFMIYVGLSKATMTQISQGMGAKDYDWIRIIMSRSVAYNLIIITFFTGIVLLFMRPLLDIFTDDTSLIALTVPMMSYLLITLFPKSINVVIGSVIRALGKTQWMLYSQILGTIVVIGLSFYLVTIAKMGVEAIFITVLADEFIRSIINTWYFIKQTEKTQIEKHVILS